MKKVDCLRIIYTNYYCPNCDNFTGCASAVREHIRSSEDEQHDAPAKDAPKEDVLFYVYLIGGVKESRSNHKFVNEPKNAIRGFKDLLLKECEHLQDDIHILKDWVDFDGKLKIQGVKEGSSRITGGISGRTKSEGGSKGVEIGPFTRGKSKSEGSIEADFNARISDNTFSSSIEFLQIDNYGIYVESDPVINVPYTEIDRVLERKTRHGKGMNVEIGESTYTFEVINSGDSSVSEAISFMKQRISEAKKEQSGSQAGQPNQTPAEKIKDLKELYDDGIISEDEFESKKDKLLDEF